MPRREDSNSVQSVRVESSHSTPGEPPTAISSLWSAVTGRLLGSVAQATMAEVGEAAETASRAAAAWCAKEPAEREALSARLLTALTAAGPQIAALRADEIGAPVGGRGRPIHALIPGRGTPGGVTGIVTSWNDPLLLGTPDLLVSTIRRGRACILMVPPLLARSAACVASAAAKAGLPVGLVRVLVSDDTAVAEAFAAHRTVTDMVTNGTDAVGRAAALLRGRARRPLRVLDALPSLAALVDDAPLDRFLAALPGLCLAGNGQYGFAQTRVLVPTAHWRSVVDGVTDAVASLRLGDPRDPSVDIGPLADEDQVDRLDTALARVWRDGARITVGGGRSPHFDEGAYVEPTVVVGADLESDIVQGPALGPVVALIRYTGNLSDHAARVQAAGLRIGSLWTASSTSEATQDPAASAVAACVA